jgi:hypothetical protein
VLLDDGRNAAQECHTDDAMKPRCPAARPSVVCTVGHYGQRGSKNLALHRVAGADVAAEVAR